MRALLFREEYDEKSGDLEEMYIVIADSKGRWQSNLWFWRQIAMAVPSFIRNTVHWRFSMLKSHLKIAIRHMSRQKMYSLINVLGLAMGMTCCLLILLWVYDEWSYDRYHEHADRIYRITYSEVIGGDHADYAMSPFAAAPSFERALPEVIAFTRLLFRSGLLTRDGETFEERKIAYVDEGFFRLFTHEFLEGNPAEALSEPGSIVLTESAAGRIFGDRMTLGETVHLNGEGDLKVTAIIRDVPKNSHFRFNALVSNHRIRENRSEIYDAWLAIVGWSYILLEDEADPEAVCAKCNDIFNRNAGQEAAQYGTLVTFGIGRITDIHLKSHLRDEIEANGDMVHVYLFTAVALFVLLIACINFINLSTARAVRRGREVGIRKALGAHRSRLIRQFLSESTVVSSVALLVSVVTMTLALPAFNGLTGKALRLHDLLSWPMGWGALGIFMMTGFLAGCYPAFVLSAFQPVNVLRGRHIKGPTGSAFRGALVVFQFSVSVILITSVSIVFRQLDHMKNRRLGFNKEQLLVIRIRGSEIREHGDAFKLELLKNSKIRNASFSSGFPGNVNSVLTTIQEGKSISESHNVDVLFVDEDFVSTYGIQIVEGRDFSDAFPSDAGGAFLINENAVARFDWGKQTLGKRIGFSDEDMDPIVGIVEDFNYRSLQHAIGLLAIRFDTNHKQYLTLKVEQESIAEILSFAEKTWKSFVQARSFSYFFVDAYFDSLYQSEERLSRIVTLFTGLALSVACLGLFGLVSFVIEQRTKEIGIRKVLGCSASRLTVALTGQFMRWIVFANAVGLPISYLFMVRLWLPNFHYRYSLNGFPLLMTFIISMSIGMVTVGIQVIRASSKKPIDSLMYE